MRRCFVLACLLFVLLAAGAAAWPQEPDTQKQLPARLPLRRDAPASAAAPSWLAATGALALLALGGTVVVGRRRRWTWFKVGPARRSEHELVRVSSQALTAQASLHAVRWNDEELLLACTPQQVTLLARRPVAAAGEELA